MSHPHPPSPRTGPIAPAALLGVGLLMSGVAAALEVRSTLTHLGGAEWEYRYTLIHDGNPPAAVRELAIGFDPARYLESSLNPQTLPPLSTEWNEQILASGPALDAFYDVQATAGGLDPGATLSGFRVRFQWIGPGTPGDQPFWVFEPGNPAPLQQGWTSGAGIAIPVSGPWALWVLALGLIAAALPRFRTRHSGGG